MDNAQENTAQRILRLARAFAEKPIPENAEHAEHVDFADMGLDSLAVALLLTDIEAEFGISLSPDDTSQLTSFQQLVQLVDQRRELAHG